MRTRPTPGALVVAAALLVGATTLAFGAWALAAPRSFAEFIDFGPYNEHLLHDVGVFQIGIGVTVLLATRVEDALTVALAGFVAAGGLHAIVHLLDLRLGVTPATRGRWERWPCWARRPWRRDGGPDGDHDPPPPARGPGAHAVGRHAVPSARHGPPLVVFRTAVPSSANPRGLERWAELRLLRPLARRFTVYAFDITVPTLVIAGSADEFYPSNWRGRSPNASATGACSSTRAETTAAC